MKPKQYRQGDVLIREIQSIPNGERKLRQDGILAHGEVTGHCHAIEDHQAAQLFNVGGGVYAGERLGRIDRSSGARPDRSPAR